MIVEVGHFAVGLAFAVCVLLSVLPMVGAARGNERLMALGGNLSVAQFVLLLGGYLALTYAFVTDDFSVAYVASNSNSLLPTQYKISALWGAHEGSFLLWTLIMGAWVMAVALRSGDLERAFAARTLSILGFIQLGFLAFLLFLSNPFERALPLVPVDGADLNPLLQDFGLIVHPPLLYMGYVGFSVAFAFAISALLSGRMDATWARASRPWTNLAWAFLTAGIALGSWWAYYELGWGGWWFWDPVENASFMPWLAGTALIHSLSVSEKRGAFRSWTLLLAIAAFSLSLLGAFIVRSGILTSVHAFAVDPERGVYILAWLGVSVGGALTLYGMRAHTIAARIRYDWLSRETFLLVNNLLLVVSLAVVFYGTLYPVAYEALTGGEKTSVGPPFFNFAFVPLMLILALFLGAAPFVRWKKTQASSLVSKLWPIALAAVALGVILPLVLLSELSIGVVLAISLGLWIVLSHSLDLWRRRRSLTASYWGMWVAHIGFAISMVGIGVTSGFSIEKDVRMVAGQTLTVADRQILFNGVSEVSGPNYVAQRGSFVITEGSNDYALYPEKRRYLARGSVMTEAAIEPGLMRDLYLSLGEPLAGDSWAVRVHIKPLVRWVWLGALLMALGGGWALLDRRYKRLRVRSSAAATA
ncbi:MAG: heme lyase CcmF/NrfE family subunit [Pseudomonadaceae bacterium]|nr:heme lyase CcmF/NrfE family subunit [Pseudomonadaceae bacterium]